MKNNRPNIILIMTDQMRGDCLSGLGHPDVKTPNLDTLMANGLCFKNAYSACPSCIPARAGLFTGLSPKHHKRVGYQDRVRFEYQNTLASELNRAGYYTQAVGKMHVHPQRNNMGFQNVILHDGYLAANRNVHLPFYEMQDECDDYFHFLKCELGADADLTDLGIESNSWTQRPFMYEEKYHPTNWVTHEAIDFLRRRDTDLPFFLFLSYVRPHPPFDAPRSFFDMYDEDALRKPYIGSWETRGDLLEKGKIMNSDTGPIDETMLRKARKGYYACISHLDNQIGRFLMALHRYQLESNTLMLFTSDHGELLGDHYMYRKIRPYQGSVHIPLFLSGPDHLIERKGCCDDLAELSDIMPTILSKAGVKDFDVMDGENLLHTERVKRTYIHGEHSAVGFGSQLGNQYIVTKEDKFIWFMESGKEQYFCLDRDPNELENRICDPACEARINELRQLLILELMDREEGYVSSSQLIAGQRQRSILS